MYSPASRHIAFVLASTHFGSMLVNRHDYCKSERSAFGVGHQLLNTSSFDPQEIYFTLQLLQSRRENFGAGVVAVDCGANIGTHTLEWSRSCRGGARSSLSRRRSGFSTRWPATSP